VKTSIKGTTAFEKSRKNVQKSTKEKNIKKRRKNIAI